MKIRKETIGSCWVFSWDEPISLEGNESVLLKEELKASIGDETSAVILDLGRVEFIDSSGLGALISALKALRTGGGTLWLTQVSEAVRSILEITRLDRVFDIVPTLDDALLRCGAPLPDENEVSA
jgi:anti-sigma B factor antagonist